MRGILKEWKNGRYLPKWTCRIRWYESGEGQDIRLQMEDCERLVNVYPKTKETAQAIWDLFKQMAPPEGIKKPFIEGAEGILFKIRSSATMECGSPGPSGHARQRETKARNPEQ